MPATRVPFTVPRWLVTAAAVAALLATAACAGFDEVRKRPEPAQQPSRPAPTEPVRPATPVPEAVPGTEGVLPETPGLRLTPPPGVVPATRVAILVPLSGEHAALGGALLNAAQLALFSLAGENFALMPHDTRGTPDGAVAAARSAVEDGAHLVLGPVFAHSVAAVRPVLATAGIQVVAFSNDSAVAGGGIYIMGFTPETQIGRIASHAAGRGVRRIAAVVPEGPFGARVENALRSAAGANGIAVDRVARYVTADTATLSPLVRRLADYDARHAALLERRRELATVNDEAAKRALKRLEGLETLGDVGFDAVLLPEGGTALRNLAPLLRFYDIDPRRVRMLGTVQWDDLVVATEPALFGGWFPAPPPEARKAFENLYAKTYGAAPPRLASLAYDATGMAAVIARARAEADARAAAQGASRPLPVSANPFTVDALTASNGFGGVDGIFRLLPSGLVERELAILEVRDRRFVVVSPAATSFRRPATN